MMNIIDESREVMGSERISEIIEMFSRGYSTRAIGESLGFSKKTAGRRLREAGIDLGGPGRKLQISDEYVELTRQLRADGMEWREISEKIGFSVRQLQKRLYSK